MGILSAIQLARVPILAFFIVGVFWGSFAASVPDIKAGLGVSDAVFGTLLLGNAFGLVTAMWMAPRIDRWLGSRGMQVVGVIFSCWFVMPGVVQTPIGFFLVLVGMGVFSGLLDVLMNARVSELEARHGRTLMNVSHGMFSVAYAVAALGTGFARDAGYAPVVALAGAGLVGIALAAQIRMAPDEVDSSDAATSSRLPWLIVLTCGAIVLAAFMSEATVETWSALHIERTLNGDPLAGAIGPVMLGLTMAVGRIGGQGLSDRFDDRLVIVLASGLASVGAMIAAVAPTPGVAYLGFGIFGLGVSVIGPLGLALVGRMVAARFRTEAIAKAAVMGFCGFFIAPVLMGLISEAAGLRVAYGAVAAFVLITLPLVWMLPRLGKPVAG